MSSNLSFKDAAITVLRQQGKPLHYVEIFDKITEQKLINTAGKTPEQTLLAAITSDITANGENSTFEKVSKVISLDYSLPSLNVLQPKAHYQFKSSERLDKSSCIKSVLKDGPQYA